MRFTLLNGEPDPEAPLNAHLDCLTAELHRRGHQAEILTLRQMNLRGCTGCFGCWLKTPGVCVKRDDSAILCRAALRSDLLLFATPMILGTTSALLLRAVEQMIPLLLPYIVIEGGEMHHSARYKHYPLCALLLGSCDKEDQEITSAIWKRTTRNMKTKLVATLLAEHPIQEEADAILAVA